MSWRLGMVEVWWSEGWNLVVEGEWLCWEKMQADQAEQLVPGADQGGHFHWNRRLEHGARHHPWLGVGG